MVHKVVFWTGFGLATRAWQLGIEQRPFFVRKSLWVWPLFGAIGGSFGYWLMGVEKRQEKELNVMKEKILAKRERRALREAGAGNVS